MELKELLKFVEIEDKRLQKYYGYIDKEKRVLARTVKLSEEVGELSNEVLANLTFQREQKLRNHQKEKLAEEFADVVITTLILANSMAVDIGKALERKIDKVNKRYKK